MVGCIGLGGIDHVGREMPSCTDSELFAASSRQNWSYDHIVIQDGRTLQQVLGDFLSNESSKSVSIGKKQPSSCEHMACELDHGYKCSVCENKLSVEKVSVCD